MSACARPIPCGGQGQAEEEAVKWIAVFLRAHTSFLYTQRHVTLIGSKDLAPGQPGVLFYTDISSTEEP